MSGCYVLRNGGNPGLMHQEGLPSLLEFSFNHTFLTPLIQYTFSAPWVLIDFLAQVFPLPPGFAVAEV